MPKPLSRLLRPLPALRAASLTSHTCIAAAPHRHADDPSGRCSPGRKPPRAAQEPVHPPAAKAAQRLRQRPPARRRRRRARLRTTLGRRRRRCQRRQRRAAGVALRLAHGGRRRAGLHGARAHAVPSRGAIPGGARRVARGGVAPVRCLRRVRSGRARGGAATANRSGRRRRARDAASAPPGPGLASRQPPPATAVGGGVAPVSPPCPAWAGVAAQPSFARLWEAALTSPRSCFGGARAWRRAGGGAQFATAGWKRGAGLLVGPLCASDGNMRCKVPLGGRRRKHVRKLATMASLFLSEERRWRWRWRL